MGYSVLVSPGGILSSLLLGSPFLSQLTFMFLENKESFSSTACVWTKGPDTQQARAGRPVHQPGPLSHAGK